MQHASVIRHWAKLRRNHATQTVSLNEWHRQPEPSTELIGQHRTDGKSGSEITRMLIADSVSDYVKDPVTSYDSVHIDKDNS